MMVSPHPLYSLLDTEVSELGFDLHPSAPFPSFSLGGLCLLLQVFMNVVLQYHQRGARR